MSVGEILFQHRAARVRQNSKMNAGVAMGVVSEHCAMSLVIEQWRHRAAAAAAATCIMLPTQPVTQRRCTRLEQKPLHRMMQTERFDPHASTSETPRTTGAWHLRGLRLLWNGTVWLCKRLLCDFSETHYVKKIQEFEITDKYSTDNNSENHHHTSVNIFLSSKYRPIFKIL